MLHSRKASGRIIVPCGRRGHSASAPNPTGRARSRATTSGGSNSWQSRAAIFVLANICDPWYSRQNATAYPCAARQQRSVRLPHSRQPWNPATHRIAPSRVSAQERSRGGSTRRRVDALSGVDLAEPYDSRDHRCCSGRFAAAASDVSGPEAVSALIWAALRPRQRSWWRMLCPSDAGVRAMIETATVSDLPEIRG